MGNFKRQLVQERFLSNLPKSYLDDLKEAVEEFMTAGDLSDRAFRHSKIASVIWDNHNMSVSLHPWRTNSESSYRISIFAPLLNKNNPLILNDERLELSNDDFDAIKFIKKPDIIKGSVDLDKGKLGGIFSDINCKLCITTSYFNGTFEADEIAEKIVHEIGHIFVYFTCLIDVVTYSYTIKSSLDALTNQGSEKLKMNMVEELGKEMGVEFNYDTVSRAKDKDSLYNVLVTETTIARRNETGSETYANRSWERLADNFVTRMGGGSALARGMEKLDNLQGGKLLRDSAYNPSSVHYMSEAAKVLFVVMGAITLPASWTLSMSVVIAYLVNGATGNYKEHDTPGNRLKRIELGIIQRLKRKDLPKEEREDLLQQLKVVRGILLNVKDKTTVVGFIGKLVSGKLWGKGLKDAKAEEFMLELEKLNSNELFTLSNQFRDY